MDLQNDTRWLRTDTPNGSNNVGSPQKRRFYAPIIELLIQRGVSIQGMVVCEGGLLALLWRELYLRRIATHRTAPAMRDKEQVERRIFRPK